MMRLFFLFCLCLSATSVLAQDSTLTYQRPARLILKVVPLALLDADPTWSGAAEIRTGQRTSVQAEFGYGRPSWNNPGFSFQHAGTWRIKAEWRVYTGRYRTNLSKNIRIYTTYPLGNYFAFEAYTKLLNVWHNWSDLPGRNPTLPAEVRPQYQTLIRRNSLSLSIKFGRQFGWTTTPQQGRARVLWDVYAGLGVRLVNQDNSGNWSEPGYTESFTGMFNRFNANGLRVAPNVSAGVKLGFAL
ncbi:hypothetical protein [Spirosoma fluminis]